MKTTSTLALLLLAGAGLLTGCASSPTTSTMSTYDTPAIASDYGTIDNIQVTTTTPRTSGAGAVVGGIVGGVLGNQIGGGSGRTAATVAGAAGGALVGNRVEANNDAANPRQMYQIGIRLDNGDYRTVVQDSVNDLSPGNRVRIVEGHAYRY